MWLFKWKLRSGISASIIYYAVEIRCHFSKKQKNRFRAISLWSFEVSIFLKSSHLKICLLWLQNYKKTFCLQICHFWSNSMSAWGKAYPHLRTLLKGYHVLIFVEPSKIIVLVLFVCSTKAELYLSVSYTYVNCHLCLLLQCSYQWFYRRSKFYHLAGNTC